MTADSVESAIALSFAGACLLVFAIAAGITIYAIVRGRALAKRAKTIVPPGMIAQAKIARIDAERTAVALQGLAALVRRASRAASSIALSLAYYRALVARLRGLAS